MRKFMGFFFICVTLVLAQLGAREHCPANTSSIEGADTRISQEYTCVVSPKDLVVDHEEVFINLDGSLFPLRALEMVDNQWVARINFGKNVGYCQRGHDLCSKCELCHKERCPYYVKPCWER